MTVPRDVCIPKQKLQFPAGYQISWVSDRVCDISLWATATMEATKEMKFDTKAAYEMRKIPELRIHA